MDVVKILTPYLFLELHVGPTTARAQEDGTHKDKVGGSCKLTSFNRFADAAIVAAGVMTDQVLVTDQRGSEVGRQERIDGRGRLWVSLCIYK